MGLASATTISAKRGEFLCQFRRRVAGHGNVASAQAIDKLTHRQPGDARSFAQAHRLLLGTGGLRVPPADRSWTNRSSTGTATNSVCPSLVESKLPFFDIVKNARRPGSAASSIVKVSIPVSLTENPGSAIYSDALTTAMRVAACRTGPDAAFPPSRGDGRFHAGCRGAELPARDTPSLKCFSLISSVSGRAPAKLSTTALRKHCSVSVRSATVSVASHLRTRSPAQALARGRPLILR